MFGVSTSGCKMNKFSKACSVSALSMRESIQKKMFILDIYSFFWNVFSSVTSFGLFIVFIWKIVNFLTLQKDSSVRNVLWGPVAHFFFVMRLYAHYRGCMFVLVG